MKQDNSENRVIGSQAQKNNNSITKQDKQFSKAKSKSMTGWGIAGYRLRAV